MNQRKAGKSAAFKGEGIDPDAQAFFDRVTIAGGTLSSIEQNAVNQLVLDLKSYEIWSTMIVIYPMVGASAASCAQNLKSSSYTGTFSSGWTFASTGAKPDGTSAYMDTGVSASSVLSISSAHMSYYCRTAPNAGVLIGNGVVSCILQQVVTQLYGGLANTSFANGAVLSNASFVMVNRAGSSILKVIQNNGIVASNTSTGTSYSSNSIYLAKYGAGFYSNAECALASLGGGFNDIEASNYYTAVQDFQTALSREV